MSAESPHHDHDGVDGFAAPAAPLPPAATLRAAFEVLDLTEEVAPGRREDGSEADEASFFAGLFAGLTQLWHANLSQDVRVVDFTQGRMAVHEHDPRSVLGAAAFESATYGYMARAMQQAHPHAVIPLSIADSAAELLAAALACCAELAREDYEQQEAEIAKQSARMMRSLQRLNDRLAISRDLMNLAEEPGR